MDTTALPLYLSHMQPDEQPVSYLREVTRFELELLDKRATWLLASQSLLFAGMAASTAATTAGNAWLTHAIVVLGSALGLLTSIAVLVGIGAAVREVHRAFRNAEAVSEGSDLTASLFRRRRSDAPFTMLFGEGSALFLAAAFVATWGTIVAGFASGMSDIRLLHPRSVLALIAALTVLLTLTALRLTTCGLWGHMSRVPTFKLIACLAGLSLLVLAPMGLFSGWYSREPKAVNIATGLSTLLIGLLWLPSTPKADSAQAPPNKPLNADKGLDTFRSADGSPGGG